MSGGHDNAGGLRWLLTYADLITLLLAFFIIMYAGSKADLERFTKLAISLRQGFGISVLPGTGGDGILPGSGSGLMPFPSLPQRSRDYLAISQALSQRVRSQGSGRYVAVNMRREGIAITLSDALLFPSGGVELSEESRALLDDIAEISRPMPNQIRVEGHTDDLPTNDPLYPTNWELSVARAVSVVRYLAEQGGIDPARLSAVGKAEYDPLFPNDTREHRALNRRADIVILYPAEEDVKPINLDLSSELTTQDVEVSAATH
ncbi:MAG: flagellar motor protein MotB [Anaerolineae bacterium]